MAFTVRFWGVRGSIACPGPDCLRYGGNTPCVEMRLGNRVLIFDGGTGLRRLGHTLSAPIHSHLFLTHTHVDHIGGIPFFSPFFDARNRFEIWAGHLGNYDKNVHDVLSDFMAAPLFPVPPAIFNATMTYHDFDVGQELRPGPGITIKTAPLNHPNGATGYRVQYGGKSVCYITDTEHVPGSPDSNILKLCRGADVMIYDSTFTDEEFPRFVGWGHSTWQEGVRLAELARVKKLVIFHHDPGHDDVFMDKVAEQAARKRAGTVVAREGMVLEP